MARNAINYIHKKKTKIAKKEAHQNLFVITKYYTNNTIINAINNTANNSNKNFQIALIQEV